MPAVRRRWTSAEVRGLQEESRPWPRYELLDGELYVTPAPEVAHQVAVTELLVLLYGFVRETGIGRALTSPADVELRPESIMQPDVFVIRPISVVDRPIVWGDITSLLLAIEVISPSSIRTDRVEKRDFYLTAGVPEYWVVDLDGRHIERWTQDTLTPQVHTASIEWRPAGTDRSLVIDLPDLFSRIGLPRRI